MYIRETKGVEEKGRGRDFETFIYIVGLVGETHT
jgi:hypothetical protein